MVPADNPVSKGVINLLFPSVWYYCSEVGRSDAHNRKQPHISCSK
ncbi:hypothetical protein PANPB_00180 (plasmid) [Pantoea sp. Nvir]